MMLVVQEQWSKQVLKALKQRHMGLGEMRKKVRESALDRTVGLKKLNKFFRWEKYRSQSQIQAACSVVLQRH